jgi:hypothetical protein
LTCSLALALLLLVGNHGVKGNAAFKQQWN